MTQRPARAPATSFLDAYLAGAFADVFAVPPGDLETALSVPRDDLDRAPLVSALERQHEAWGAGAAATESLRKLAHPNSRVVVTGQQIGWLLGPTFALSKAVTALLLARRLDSEERPVVPVFWMATQDHDVDEMNHAWLLDREERLTRLEVEVKRGPAVGRARLDPSEVQRTRMALRRLDGDGPHAAEVDALLARACEGAQGWSEGFARLLLELFGEAGLLVVDPLEPSLALLGRDALERELADPGASAAAIREAGASLAERSWQPLLGRGEDASNLFVERPGGGSRTLLRHRAGALYLGGERVELSTLRAYLDEDPTSVTPAAGLRPVIQDLLLPSAAFVVGPGELRYLAQLRPVYQAHGVHMPLIWPRASVTVLQPPVRRILRRHGLDWRAVQADPRHEECELQLRRHGYADRAAAAFASVEREFTELLEATSALDPTLERAVRRGRYHLERTVVTLREKTGRALVRQDAEVGAQFARLRAHLRPNGGLQERVLSPFSHFLTLGVEPVRDAFLRVDPAGDHALEF